MKRGKFGKKLRGKFGQVSMFVIIGIVILAAVLLILFYRGQFFFPATPQALEDRMNSIREHVSECIREISPEYINRIGLQGGYLATSEGTYRKDNDVPISYLCYNVEDKPNCYNRMLTLNEMESQLSEAIKNGLMTCINLRSFGRGADLQRGNLNVETEIGREEVIVTANMPVTLKRGDLVEKEEEFFATINKPLGKLYEVSQDVIDVETEFGEFDQLSYLTAIPRDFIIEKKRPYPDKLYIIIDDSGYVFQFFVQDEPS